jgi:hypothetical protein
MFISMKPQLSGVAKAATGRQSRRLRRTDGGGWTEADLPPWRVACNEWRVGGRAADGGGLMADPGGIGLRIPRGEVAERALGEDTTALKDHCPPDFLKVVDFAVIQIFGGLS